MSSYLLEIGLEEMPAHLVTPAIDQLAERLGNFLKENRVTFDKIVKLSTPRRLAVLVEEIAEKSEAIDEEVKGPSVKIAKDSEGNWSKAIQGFSRGQGLMPDDLVRVGDYYYAKKHIEGLATTEILSRVGDEVIRKMQFSTYMKWGNYDFQFIRPIQWLVSLYNSEVVPFTLLDNKAGRVSRGHRFLANHSIELVAAQFYERVLQENFVITYAPARKLIIAQQIMHLADQKDWQVDLHDELLEEINNLVEYPKAFAGAFDEKYLKLPEEVLITSMRDNQRYFEVRDKKGNLLPVFISVRNGLKDNIETVIKGNEKVLIARLEDAKFFWEEDQKLKIDVLAKKLENVTFHIKIGSLSEHMIRTGKIASYLTNTLKESEQVKVDLERASEIYKFDLLTLMVGEFAELQGIMGEKYALLAGENRAVSQAIREHYLPTSSEGDLPVSIAGAILATADKLDSLNSFFAAGLIPSGSNDPYALRRAAAGILRIIEDQRWDFDLKNFIFKDEIIDFMKGRIVKFLEEEVRGDIIEAVIAVKKLNVYQIIESARVIDHHKEHLPFKNTIENISRVINLVKKAENIKEILPENFENSSERALYETVIKLEKDWEELTPNEKFRSIVQELAPAIEVFFDNTMIMVEDEALRDNRLALLNRLVKMTETMADFSLIQTK